MKRTKKFIVITLALLFLFPLFKDTYCTLAYSSTGHGRVYINPYQLPVSTTRPHLVATREFYADTLHTVCFRKEIYSQVAPNANFINGFPIMLIKQ